MWKNKSHCRFFLRVPVFYSDINENHHGNAVLDDPWHNSKKVIWNCGWKELKISRLDDPVQSNQTYDSVLMEICTDIYQLGWEMMLQFHELHLFHTCTTNRRSEAEARYRWK